MQAEICDGNVGSIRLRLSKDEYDAVVHWLRAKGFRLGFTHRATIGLSEIDILPPKEPTDDN